MVKLGMRSLPRLYFREAFFGTFVRSVRNPHPILLTGIAQLVVRQSSVVAFLAVYDILAGDVALFPERAALAAYGACPVALM